MNGFNHYVKLEEIVHMAKNMEKQLKQKGTIWQSQTLEPSKPSWKDNTGVGPSQQNKKGKAEYPREKKNTSIIIKGNNVTPTSCNRDIKCFHCLSFGHVASQSKQKSHGYES
jgi:hypothetical protein